ncbi:MAG: hypothetical protein H0T46_22565 [Deltaproteobacteria bacterium]|nr:hypothetical protein [Deltaproteobacteria bacterium]
MRSVVPLVLLAACGGGSGPVPTGERVGAGLSTALAGADKQRAPWRCAALDGPTLVDETLKGWKLAGHTLTADATGDFTIGTIADAGGAAPATIAALARIKPKLASANLVIALGGMGTTQAELEATLGAIAEKAPYPVVALPGDLEGAGALTAAIATLRAKGLIVIDGRLAQRIELPGASIATIAGASADSRLVAGADGCAYRAADLPSVLGALTARPGLRILATAEAPRITIEGEPAGELALTPGAGTEIDIVLHGPVSIAASKNRTGGRDADAIALTPGSADATPRLPGGLHAPTAGLLSIKGASWTWKSVADSQ